MLPNALAQLSMPRFIQNIFAIKYQSRRKPNKCRIFSPPFFYGRLLARFTVHRLAQFG